MKNSTLERFGVSMEHELIKSFDKLVGQKGFANRSEAIRNLVRNFIIEECAKVGSKESIGTITLVYDHHVRDLNDKLNDLQHDHHDLITSTTHVHLDHNNCLEVLIVRGKGSKIKKIADQLISTRGVKHGKLSITSTGKEL